MNQKTANNLINKTRDDYNLIADQFASTRKYNWGDLKAAFDTFPLKNGDKVLDLGCGNGRMYDLMKKYDISYYGLDISENLLKHAKKKVPDGHFKSADLLKNNYKDAQFDAVVSVATLHHLPTKTARINAISEIYRITKPGGIILVSNWYFWNQPQYRKLLLQNIAKKIVGKSELDYGDFYMDWKNSKRTILTSRYFHAWTKKETIHLLKKTGFSNIQIIYHQGDKIGRNLIAIAKKPE